MLKISSAKQHIDGATDNAVAGKSKLIPPILSFWGMSSPRNRHLLNNLLDFPDVNYLEIGVYTGSTFVSALYGNEANAAYAIDNWSQFSGHASSFEDNCKQYGIKHTLIEGDCFQIDRSRIKEKINVYFYDGEHTDAATFSAINYYYDLLDDEFIFIVDDFDWWTVEKGVRDSVSAHNLNTVYERVLKSNGTNDNETWWNGIYVSILRK